MKSNLPTNLTGLSAFQAILKFSAPLVLGNLLQHLYNLTDAWIVSNYINVSALGSIGATSSIQFLVIGFCIGFGTGLSIPVAHSYGAEDFKRTDKIIRNCISVSLITSIVLTLIFCFLINPILRLLQTPESLYKDAFAYIVIIFLGIIAVVFYNLGAAILRSTGDSRSPVFYLILSLLLNLLLDIFLIVFCQMGVYGAALGTVISQAFSSILCFRKIYIVNMSSYNNNNRILRFDTQIVKELFGIGIPMGLQYSITALGAIIIQSANNGLGDNYTIAFAAGSKIRQFFMCPFDALATGTTIYIAHNMGNRHFEKIKGGVLTGVIISVAYGICAGLLLYISAPILTNLVVNKDHPSFDLCLYYLRIIGCSLWMLGILNVCRLSVQGLKFSKTAMISGIIELFSRIILVVLWIPFYQYKAVCMNEPFAWICASIYISTACSVIIKKIERSQR